MKNAPTLKEQQAVDKDQEAGNYSDTESPQKVKVAKVEQTAFQSFIERNQPSTKVFVNITDMPTWKKRHRVDDSTKVFIIKGGYPDIRKALK